MELGDWEARTRDPFILAVISPFSTFDEILARQVNDLLALMSILLFPVCMAMGFPLMAQALVLEKEEGVKRFLEINGMKWKGYWVVVVLFYWVFFGLCSIFFMGYGWVFVGDGIFSFEGWTVLSLVMVAWNTGQIGLGVLFSGFFRDSGKAACKKITPPF